MKTSDEIFLLIRSLSGKEKLFFRKKYLLLTSDADNNYLKLFDEISKQADAEIDYDESKIKKGSYTGKFIKNLSFHKNFLYNAILSSLSFFHKDSRDIFIVRNLITQAEILSDKLLHVQSLKILQRTKKTSSEKDLLNSKYEIINTERLIGKYSDTVEEYSVKMKELFRQQYDILEFQQNLLDYFVLNDKVSLFSRKSGSGRIRDKEELVEFENVFENPLLRNIENAKTFQSRIIFYNLNIQFNLTKNNFEEAYKNAKSGADLWKNNNSKITGRLVSYVNSLNNLLNCEIRTKRFNECELTAAKMRSIAESFPGQLTESIKVFIFYSLSILMLSKNMAVADTEKLRTMETEIRNDLRLYEEKITLYQRIILFYFLSSSNFTQGEFEKCIYWTGKIFNLSTTDLSEDYQCYAKIIQLISYYELGYTNSMEYALKSAYHFISKRKRVYKYENIIQKYLRKSFRIKTNKELQDMFREMKQELEEIFHDEYERNAFDAFNILPWLESRIRGISTIQVIKEKISGKLKIES